jgi:hypothetical protein
MPRPTRLYEQGRAITQWAPPKPTKKKPRQTGGTGRGFWVPLGGNLSDGRGMSTITTKGIACMPLGFA